MDELQLGVVTTHPIQYQVPLFRELNRRSGVQVSVFYERIPGAVEQGEDFESSFTWDLPLLDGYPWKVMKGGHNRKRECGETGFSDFAQVYRDVDVMLIHGWQSGYMRRAWWSGLWTDVPLLVRGDSNNMKPRPWYIRLIHRLYVRPFQQYLYVGEGNRKFYQNAGIPSEALYFSPRCVENSRFHEDWRRLKNSQAELRAEHGVSGSAICFLFCGKFVEKKRPTDVVRAFVKLHRETDRSVHLLMVGDGNLSAEVKARVPEGAPVTFTGFLNQTEIGEAYAVGDVLILPSDYGETWGLVVNEAMIFGCPAIVSDRVGCGPDLIREGETGFTVPFGDMRALAGTMAQMAEHPERIPEMGAAARDLVLSEYTIERAADGIVEAARDAYHECL